MIAIESVTDERDHRPTHQTGDWQPRWTPLVPPIQDSGPAAVAEAGTAEQDPGRQRDPDESARDRREEPVRVLISARTQTEPAATYSPASLHATHPPEPGQIRSEEDEEFLRQLRDREQEVRAHEQAHAAALGPYAGVIHYTYQIGPDGRAYAIGGSIQVNMRRESSPAADLFKAQTIARAATGAGDPSDADMAVAAQASQQARDAAQGLG